MKIKKSLFLSSNSSYLDCPNLNNFEIALIGRSNVGKSSFINFILNEKIAKVSQIAGKTKLINFFLINDDWYLVDLPGYGWSKNIKYDKFKWKKIINNYILYRKNLSFLCVLIDLSISIQKVDISFLNWLGINKIPFIIIFSKSDKLSKSRLLYNINNFISLLVKYWSKIPKFFITSIYKKIGKKVFLQYIKFIFINKKINLLCGDERI